MPAVHLIFFAHLKEISGTDRAELTLPAGSTVLDLKDHLLKEFPALEKALPTAILAINREFAFDTDGVPEDAEVAIFPPVSGGSGMPTVFRITHDVLDLDELLDQITLPSTGAAAVFTGMVRGITTRDQAHETVALEYEAYVPMAEAKMAQVAGEIRERWPAMQGIAIVQRIGRLEPRTPTVLIACTAAHRDTGIFDAARYGIDRLKEIVPIWKKEILAGGEVWIEGEYHPHKGD
jgi:molybdopterin synthase catalytic subunit